MVTEDDWLDKIPYSHIPLELTTAFKSGEDWLDDWEECVPNPVKKKPFTFDDKVDAYRRNIKVALEKTEREEEKDVEVDLVFADIDETADDPEMFKGNEKFTPSCSPSKLNKTLGDCEMGGWDSDWDDQDEDDHPTIRPDKVQLYV